MIVILLLVSFADICAQAVASFAGGCWNRCGTLYAGGSVVVVVIDMRGCFFWILLAELFLNVIFSNCIINAIFIDQKN